MLPLADILVGVALDKVAVPPLIDKEKSPTSSAPLPASLLNTASSSVTVMVLLSAASVTAEIVGAT